MRCGRNIVGFSTMTFVYPIVRRIDYHDLKHNNHYLIEGRDLDNNEKSVNVKILIARLKDEKKKDRKNNLILSAAAVSAVTVFGIILTL